MKVAANMTDRVPFPLLVFVWFFSLGLVLNVHGEDEAAVIRIDGSNGVMPLVKELIEPFEKENPDLKIKMGEGWSSKTRLQALAEGKMDVAMASHGLKPEVLAELKLTPHLFAKMAVVFAVHESVTVRDLTAEQLAGIYSGKITNWQEVGGKDLKIVKMMRPEDEVDTEVIRAELPGFETIVWAKDTEFHDSSGDLARALDRTPGAIGVTTLVRTQQGAHTFPLKLEGVVPGEEEISNGKYPLARGSYLVTPDKPSTRVQRLLTFLGTDSGKDAIRKSHAVPISAN